jgi:hypothetical protein
MKIYIKYMKQRAGCQVKIMSMICLINGSLKMKIL